MHRPNDAKVEVLAPSRGLLTRLPSNIAARELARSIVVAKNVRADYGVLRNAPGYERIHTEKENLDSAPNLIFQSNILNIDKDTQTTPIIGTGQRLYVMRRRSRTVDCSAAPCSTTFAVVADSGKIGQPAQDVADLVAGWNPDFVLHLGDMVYADGVEEDGIEDYGNYEELVARYWFRYIGGYNGVFGYGPPDFLNAFFPIPGNHDWDDDTIERYQEFFTLPPQERYYAIKRGPVHLVMLSTDDSEPDGRTEGSVQQLWAADQVSNSDCAWRIVCGHHPFRTSDIEHVPGDTDLEWIRALGADLGLFGHAHNYERFSIDGFPLINCGLGGHSIRNFGAIQSGSQFRFNDDYGAIRVDASWERLLVRFYSRDGTLVDSYEVERSASVSLTSETTISSLFDVHYPLEDGPPCAPSGDGPILFSVNDPDYVSAKVGNGAELSIEDAAYFEDADATPILNFDKSEDLSLSVLVKFETVTGTQTILSSYEPGGLAGAYKLQIVGGVFRWEIGFSPDIAAVTGGIALPGVWYWVLAEYDKTADVIRLYVNNQLIGSASASAAIVEEGFNRFTIGSLNDETDLINATVDEVGVGLRILTSDERETLKTLLLNSVGDVCYTSDTARTAVQLVVEPDCAVVEVGHTWQYRARVFFADGTSEDVTEFATWTSADEGIATVNAGLARGIDRGETDLTAIYAGLSASACIEVLSACVDAPLDLVFVFDVSASMASHSGISTRLQKAKNAAKALVDELQPDDRIAVVAYSGDFEAQTENGLLIHGLSSDFPAVQSAIDSVSAGGATGTADGLDVAKSELLATGRDEATKLVVLLTDSAADVTDPDGDPSSLAAAVAAAMTAATDSAEAIKDEGFTLVVAGLDVPTAHEATIEAWASPGYYFDVDSADDLALVLKDIPRIYCTWGEYYYYEDDETCASPKLDYTGWANWDVIGTGHAVDGFGKVDLCGEGTNNVRLYDLHPGNGLYVDLVGTTEPFDGGLKSKDLFGFEPGNVYRLSLKLGGNRRQNLAGFQVLIRCGPLDELVTIDNWQQPFTEYAWEFTVDEATASEIRIQHAAPHTPPRISTVGTFLDDVVLENLTTEEVMFSDDFDEENPCP